LVADAIGSIVAESSTARFQDGLLILRRDYRRPKESAPELEDFGL
jgi:hypothetical protein